MFKEGRYLDRVIERQLRETATTAAFMDIYTYLNYWKTAKIESKNRYKLSVYQFHELVLEQDTARLVKKIQLEMYDILNEEL